MSTISQEESLLLQCLATTSLLGELSNANFLESDYYKQLSFSNKNIKNILTQFGLRNPATIYWVIKTGLNRKNHTCIWYFVHSGIFILNYSDNSNFYLLI